MLKLPIADTTYDAHISLHEELSNNNFTVDKFTVFGVMCEVGQNYYWLYHEHPEKYIDLPGFGTKPATTASSSLLIHREKLETAAVSKPNAIVGEKQSSFHKTSMSDFIFSEIYDIY